MHTFATKPAAIQQFRPAGELQLWKGLALELEIGRS